MRLHSVLSRKCEVRDSSLAGIGVFALQSFSRGEWVALWGGCVYAQSEVEEIGSTHPHFATHPVSIFDGHALASTSLTQIDDAERFNHSCNPNIGVKGQIVLLARRRIRAGEELCFDYQTTETSLSEFECRCGSPDCRRQIDGHAWLDPEFRKRHRGWFSWYLAERMRRQSRRVLKEVSSI